MHRLLVVVLALNILILEVTASSSYDEQRFDWDVQNIRRLVKCRNKHYKSTKEFYYNYWVLKNYIKAEHGPLSCYSNVTYTTHADYRYLDNLVPLLERWRSPLSLALYAPGDDFQPTLDSILWLRQCHPSSHLVRELTSVHFYFNVEHLPQVVPMAKVALQRQLNCSAPSPYENVKKEQLYRTQEKLDYPVNIGRNLARAASLTHFVLASDIELYPTPGLVPNFLNFFSRKVVGRHVNIPLSPMVYVLRIFEVRANETMPKTKPELQKMLRSGGAVLFHENICAECHQGPKLEEWINEPVASQDLNVFNVGYRLEPHELWEPIFIGTVDDPPYDERLSWEGRRDKMTQAYAMCVLGYEFHILDNAFLVHKPGIKEAYLPIGRVIQSHRTDSLISREIFRELRFMYGSRKGCII
ncbi:beta-1,4-glucuronyltransferase 1 isoform X1 [Drosophila bipectinata]|uniref:beta-1,4-glucuronyltransferase 1 isoform X1 n=1 Tax=Drosophila bipectinata TaxID=42026 RepID=UPI001C89FA48|nr:beta-1,4-glucuronyltransferase 1 [Drosophila bipectinata]